MTTRCTHPVKRHDVDVFEFFSDAQCPMASKNVVILRALVDTYADTVAGLRGELDVVKDELFALKATMDASIDERPALSAYLKEQTND